MDDPFDSETTDEVDAFDAASADEASDAAGADFDAGEAGDDLDADGAFDAGDALDDADGLAADDGFGDEADAAALWDAFEEEVADGLDAADEDEFLGRVLGGLGRAAGVLGRGLGGAAGMAGRMRGLAGRAGRIAGQVRRVAGRVSPAAAAAARLARMLGAPGLAGGLQGVAGGARQVQGWAGRAGRLAGAAGRTAGGAQDLLGQLSQLIGGGGDEFDDFDAMADLFEEGMDEALPAAVALAARAAARGLGFRNVAQLSQAGRRALVRGVGAAARELMRQRGPRAVRALPRLAQSAARVATRQMPTPGRAAQAVRRGLPRTARRVAQSPQTLRRLARPAGGAAPAARAPLARDPRLGRGQPTSRITGPRTFYIDGPVALTVTPR
jgi:hypothetical protein